VSEAGRAVRQALALAALSVVVAAALHVPLIKRFVRGEFRETFFEAAAYPGIRLIMLEEAEDLWRAGASAVLDARTEDPYARGHVPGARNVPVAGARTDLPEELRGETPGRTLVIYCEGGDCRSSLILAKRLHDEGFRDIRVFSGGWAAWTEAGLPEERSEKKAKGEKGDGQE
jgi:rhodanese-related sulfurtransferase